MQFGRMPKNENERELIKRCYKAGMGNQWASGRVAKEEGNFIVEEDRLNQNNICFIGSVKELKNFFKFGNWCLGQGVIHKNLFFLQQIDGGDEWATYEIQKNKIISFESVSFKLIIKDKEFEEYLKSLSKGKEEYWKEGNKENVIKAVC